MSKIFSQSLTNDGNNNEDEDVDDDSDDDQNFNSECNTNSEEEEDDDRYIQNILVEQPYIKVKAILAYLVERFSITAIYKKVWKAKQKTIANAFEDRDEPYKKLYDFMHVAVTLNKRSVWDIENEECCINNRLSRGVKQLKRMFWSYKPCIEGFKHCKYVLYIDVTFFFRKYKSVLLTAEAISGNNKILLVVFAIIENKSKDN
ncbi:uncharacterized protein LOC107261474 [Ricinus communis]|uniref:uncharacterized protein LOC107261474 n=1 Tax=Ricinus communis TaxID=3988 RepID=UPI0007726DE2|nr:uncharacterized protein LOC107261474 [Ricinus communis]|eukprot:XP_015576510.1 uncharacterized protein LOC107261474 [Ricinus communis]